MAYFGQKQSTLICLDASFLSFDFQEFEGTLKSYYRIAFLRSSWKEMTNDKNKSNWY